MSKELTFFLINKAKRHFKGWIQKEGGAPKEEYIKEYKFDLIMPTGIKHIPNIEVRASQKISKIALICPAS